MKEEVPLDQIGKRLKELWESEESEGKTKAALFNLILYIQDLDHSDYIRKVTRRVREKFPCRVIFLCKNPDPKEDYLRATLSVEGLGNEGIACDEIDLQFTCQHDEKIPFLVLPHLLPDLPVYFLWSGDPLPSDHIFPLLRPYITRLIFDPDNLQDLTDITPHFRGDIADLKWAHIQGWRLVIASVFNSPERMQALANPKLVQITYTTHETPFKRDPRLHALYLQGWLTARMGWKKTQIQLIADEDSEVPYGSIVQVGISSDQGINTLLTLDRESRYVTVKSDSPEKCLLPYTIVLPNPGRGQALVNEIFRRGTSPHYREMLERLA